MRNQYWRIRTSLILILASISASASPVSKEMLLAKAQAKKHWKDISTLSLECVTFIESNSNKKYFEVEVREVHSGKCVGDPGVSPILAQLSLNRKTKKVFMADQGSGESVELK